MSKATNNNIATKRGHLFEIAIRCLLAKNGFRMIQAENIDVKLPNTLRVKEEREGFIELRGRGAWHQIDCPFDYKFTSPFMYPIRLIGEVKFYKKSVGKDKIREFIGVLKDIQENYFVPVNLAKNTNDILPCRYLEVGAFFSAEGFCKSAEELAYAHGIKTISYNDNIVAKEIKDIVIKYANIVKIEHINKHLRHITQSLNNNKEEFKYLNNEDVKKFLHELLDSINKIKGNFFATTYDGTMIHFLSYAEFPEKVFIDKDEAICKVKCKHIDSDDSINLVLSFENNDKTEFYFSPPKILAITKETGFEFGVNNSMERFKRMTFTHIIDGKQRNLVLMIDNDSFQSSLEEYNNFRK